MATTRNVQKIGNSKGLILTSELQLIGADGQVEIEVHGDRIVIKATKNPRLTPGPNRQTRDEATRSTFAEYGTTLKRLGETPD